METVLNKISIRNYRGYLKEQTFKFSVPDGNEGSGLTLIVGQNNTGKTTFIEALTFHYYDGNNKRFNPSERNGNKDPLITLVTNKGTEKITNNEKGSQVKFIDDKKVSELNIEVIASRRYWQSQYSGGMEHDTFATQSAKTAIRNAGDIGTGQLLATINEDKDKKARLTNLMKRLVPDFAFWTVDTREPAGDYLKYKTGSGVEHAVDMMGDGIISLFRIAGVLTSDVANKYVLVIDEPELSLHPTAQKALRSVLSEYSANKQIIVVTHSPYFVEWQDLANGTSVIRLNKYQDKKCTVHQLKSEGSYANLLNKDIADWHKPEFLDLVAKEVLFTSKVLFVEGKEDVGILRLWLANNNIKVNFDIFGYGVGGETNMPFFLELAKDLGIEKVTVLFDAKTSKYEQCKKDYPEYLIQELKTEDIRDKDAGADGKTRLGTFDKSGVIKEDQEADFVQIINNITNYFSK